MTLSPASVAPLPVESRGRPQEELYHMALHETPEHRSRNDAQLAVTKRQRPDLWQRLLSLMTPAERADAERRAEQAERDGWREGGRP